MAKVLTIGEIMLRLQPFGYKRLLQADAYEANFGGGEANVAVSLAQFGVKSAFCTKLPSNDIGDACINTLRAFDVDTAFVARGGERIGIYFCEKGAAVRPSKIIYDRANSAVTTLTCADIDINNMLDGVKWLHFTGITPALGEGITEFLTTVLRAAKAKNITVSCDLNYRKKLWTKEKAKAVMSDLMQFVDVLISNEEDCKDVFGLVAENSDITGGELSACGYAAVARQIYELFGINKVAFTLRGSVSASVNNWSGMFCDGGQIYQSKKYVLNIVDRVGGGDSFGAGLIYALLNGYNSQDALNFAVAASAWKHSVEGDFNIASVDEITKLAEGDGSGRVQR